MPLRFDDNGALLAYPGDDGMTIKRIPLPEDLVRLEALKAAVESCRDGELAVHVLQRAARFEAYIREGEPNKEEPGVWCIGPEESGQIMSIYSEEMARNAAMYYPDTIYFFARLGN